MTLIAGILLAAGVAKTPPPAPQAPALLPDSLRWDSVSFYGRTVEGQIRDGQVVKPPVFETFRFDEVGLDPGGRPAAGRTIDDESSLGASICRIVEDSLAKAFGTRGGNPDFEYLAKVFRGTHKGVLKGRVIPGWEEKVEYYWVSPLEWIQSLKEMAQAGRRFNVLLSIIWMYQDVQSSNRFWAVVKQQWETNDASGNALYGDDGFLFLNFDLDERKHPCDIRVNYRLWFYNYKNSDKKGLKPHQRIAQDIRAALDPTLTLEANFGRLEGQRWVADASARGLSGIDRDLINRMANDLVNGIRAARGE